METLSVEQFPAVFSFVQLVCCLSHGQSAVERGFSVNRDTAQHNMSESTFVYRRLIKDHLISHNETPATFEITDELLLSCAGVRSKYEQFIAEERLQKSQSKAEAENESIDSKLKELYSEKSVLTKASKSWEDKFEKLFDKGCKSNDMSLFHQASGLKRKINENNETVEKIDKHIAELKKARRSDEK